jgi:hypothetical protein
MAFFYSATAPLIFEYGTSVYETSAPPPPPGSFSYGITEAGYFDYGGQPLDTTPDFLPAVISSSGGGSGAGQMGSKSAAAQVLNDAIERAERMKREAEDEFNEVMAVLMAVGVFA